LEKTLFTKTLSILYKIERVLGVAKGWCNEINELGRINRIPASAELSGIEAIHE